LFYTATAFILLFPQPAREQLFAVILETPGGLHTIECGRDEYLLDAAARSGIRLPSICRQGWCLTCSGELLSGAVDETDAQEYYPEDRTAGFVLLCRGKPCSDLRIRTHRQDEMRAHRAAHGLPAPYG
jgi:ferredoxin